MRILGVDPGAKGAIAELVDGRLTEISSMPIRGKKELDAWALANLFLFADLIVLEKVWSTPRDGHAGAFTFGGYFHVLRAVGQLYCRQFVQAKPQEWKAKVLGPRRGVTHEEQKAFACAFASERVGPAALLRTPRCRKPDDNRAEAFCLALYGLWYCTPDGYAYKDAYAPEHIHS